MDPYHMSFLPAGEGVPVVAIAGAAVDLLQGGAGSVAVTADDGLERRGGHHILKAGEPFRGAALDLVDDAFRPATAVADHYLGGRLPAIELVTLQRTGRIGVICTRATAESMAYEDAFAAAPHIELTTRACPRFVDFVEAGVTGFICDHPSELAAAIRAVDQLDPAACRRRVVENFDVSAMSEGYAEAYELAIRKAATASAR